MAKRKRRKAEKVIAQLKRDLQKTQQQLPKTTPTSSKSSIKKLKVKKSQPQTTSAHLLKKDLIKTLLLSLLAIGLILGLKRFWSLHP